MDVSVGTKRTKIVATRQVSWAQSIPKMFCHPPLTLLGSLRLAADRGGKKGKGGEKGKERKCVFTNFPQVGACVLTYSSRM